MTEKAFRGCKNYLLRSAQLFDYASSVAQDAARRRGAVPSFTCLVDPEALYKTSLGSETDIVQKEMFKLASGDFVLRPEGTANLLNAFLAELHSHPNPLPSKHFYMGPMFRYERPQLGRYRQFWQFGVEFLNSRAQLADDIELVSLASELLEELGVRSRLTFLVNNIGDQTARQRFSEHIRSHFAENPQKKARLSHDSQRRLQMNPLRILDSKDEGDQELVRDLPPISDFVSGESTKNFDRFLESMGELGLAFTVDPTLVRGLDYYNDLCFEFVLDDPSKKKQALLAGGRYDGLASLVLRNSRQVYGTGFAMGLDRLIDHFGPLIANKMSAKTKGDIRVGYLILEDEKSLAKAMLFKQKIANWAQKRIVLEVVTATPKDTGKKLDLLWERGCRHCIIVGDNEVSAEEVVVRDLGAKTQVRMRLAELEARTVQEVFGPNRNSNPFYGA